MLQVKIRDRIDWAESPATAAIDAFRFVDVIFVLERPHEEPLAFNEMSLPNKVEPGRDVSIPATPNIPNILVL
jgi:hypothetical protein